MTDDAPSVVELIQCLLNEIMETMGHAYFSLDPPCSVERLRSWIAQGQTIVLLAEVEGKLVGCLALSTCFALYAGGAFGVVTELFVQPLWRSQGLGGRLLDEAGRVAAWRGWKRLEVTTPPLPTFERTLAFYQRQGFEITGGRKLKRVVVPQDGSTCS